MPIGTPITEDHVAFYRDMFDDDGTCKDCEAIRSHAIFRSEINRGRLRQKFCAYRGSYFMLLGQAYTIRASMSLSKILGSPIICLSSIH